MQLVRYSVFNLTENKVKWRKDVKIMSVWFRIKETSQKYRIFMGTCKMRNEIETKRIETKRNKSKRNSPKRNEICLVSFRFCFVSVNFVSFRWISFRFISFSFVSFRFRFAFYRYPRISPRFSILRKMTYRMFDKQIKTRTGVYERRTFLIIY